MRHDEIVKLLCNWIKAQAGSSIQLIADVVGCNQVVLQEIFQKFRPDVVLLYPDRSISIWELTICHETNIEKSRAYKREKYSSLADDLMPKYKGFRLTLNTIEVTSLGLMSDKLSFNLSSSLKSPPVSLLLDITRSVISNSYNIYRNRNFVWYIVTDCNIILNWPIILSYWLLYNLSPLYSNGLLWQSSLHLQTLVLLSFRGDMSLAWYSFAMTFSLFVLMLLCILEENKSCFHNSNLYF